MKHFLFFIVLFFVFSSTYSRKFYFSSSAGNDTYTVSQAQNPATPWKTLQKLQTFGNSGAAAGDTFLFKRGDLFDNGYNGTMGSYGSMKWWSINGYTCPSGTLSNPIVFTSYGDASRPKPNFLFPFPSTSIYNNKYVLSFEGVSNVVIDGLQFNDFRFSDTAKVTTAYTSSALLLGEYGAINTVSNFKVTNCIFNRVGYAILSAGRNFEISYNIATNLKSVGDTSGSTDIGADFIVAFGPRYRIHHNFVSGCWYYTSGTGGGKGGGVFEVGDNFDSSFIGYNTFIDNDRCFEGGSIFDPNVGCNEDTIAYNKFINNGGVSYLHQGNAFGGKNSNWHFWNNVIVENAYSRFSGPNFGANLPAFDTDTLGNINLISGQSFWKFPTWGGGSNNCGRISSAPCGTTGMPLNPSVPYLQCNACNNGGSRVFQYTSDANVPSDTLYDIRNNIIWNANNLTVFYDTITRTKFKHRNNILKLSGGSATGGLSSTDILTTSGIFVDTSNSNPFYWDYNLLSNSPAINAGMRIGLNSDFSGNSIVENPEVGIYEFSSTNANPLVINVSAGSIPCNGGSASVTVSATGGTPPYSGTGTFSAIAGTRTFTITDITGSSKFSTINLSQPNAIISTVTAGRIIIFGGTTTITVTATGGTGTFTYKLNSGAYQSSNIFSNVTKGVDTIYVKDANGCIATSYITITQPSAPFVANATASATTICNGSTATINLTGTGGTAPYTGTGNFTVTAGTYTYTIVDSNGVSASKSITISQYNAITSTVTAGTITIYGAKTTLSVSNAAGGLSPYTYSLNGGVFQTSSSFSNVGAGTHNITIKDARGCTSIKTISISQPPSTLNCSSTSTGTILCNGTTVNVTVTATGGTPPYTGTGTFAVTGGAYSYTVTDAVGSVKTTSITISQPTAIVPTITAGRIIVFGATTTITVTAIGGTGAYTYKLNRGTYQTANTFTGIPASRDTIYVKDVNGCVASGIITITQPLSALAATASITSPISCNGGTATINVTATGGTAPYTGRGIFTVVAGTYNYTVTDSNGVTNTTSVVVSQPTILAATASSGTIAAYGGTTSISVAASGGTTPYSYSLNNGAYQLTNSFSSVLAGTYSVNIKDTKGCMISKPITITQPPSTLNCTATASGPILCNGNSVTVTVAATGGTPPYTGTGSFNIPAGSYTYTVTDAVGTVRTSSISLTQPNVISPTITSGRIISFGGTTTITVTAVGGTGAYSYKLNTGTYQTTNTFTGVPAGRDTVYVKDANGCIASGAIVITQPLSALTANVSTAATTICNGSTAVLNVTATGGTPPYTGTGSFTVSAGTYTYTVTDSNGVRTSSSITINQFALISATVTAGTISVYGAKTTVTVSNAANGLAPYTYSINGGAYQTLNTFSNIGAGIHSINIKDSRGCIINKSVTITQPPSTLNMTATPSGNILCNGGTVSVVVAATGGTPPYSGTGNFNAVAGLRTFTVTDAVGSVKSISLDLAQPSPISNSINSGRILIYGGTTNIIVTASGGTGTITYKLNSGNYQSSNTFSNINAGPDTIYIKDANGCIVTSRILITQPSQLIASYSNTSIACNGGTSIVSIAASGGIAPYTGTGSFNQLAGTVNYTIRDSAGASATIPVTITQPATLSQPTLTQGAAILTYGGTTTVDFSRMSGGTSPYTYALDNGTFQSNPSVTTLGGTHIFKVRDANGCLVNKSMFILQPVKIFFVSKSDQTCAGAANGSLSVTADGGNKPYLFRIYKINYGSSTSTTTYPYSSDTAFLNLLPNTYTIRVKDSAGALDTVSILIRSTTVTCTKNGSSYINEEQLKTDASEIYKINPNPVNDFINLQASTNENSNYLFEIFDITGNLIKKYNAFYSPTFRIQVNNLNTGYYFLKINSGKKIRLMKFYKN